MTRDPHARIQRRPLRRAGDTAGASGPPRVGPRHLRALLAAAAAVALISACGSSSTKGSSQATNSTGTAAGTAASTGATAASSGSSGSATGSPLTLAFSLSLSGGTQIYPDGKAGAEAAEKAINAAGGIQGHPLKIDFCDGQQQANAELQCARTAGTDGSFAAVLIGIFDQGDAATYTADAEAVLAPSTNAGDNVPPYFPVASYAPVFTVTPALSQKLGISKMAVMATDVAAATDDIAGIQAAAQKANEAWGGSVVIPLSATVYSAYAEKLKQSGAHATAMLATTPQMVGLIKASQQLGLNMTWYVPSANFPQSTIGQIGSQAASHVIVIGPNPTPSDTSLPAVKDYNDDLSASGVSPNDQALHSGNGFMSWLTVYAIAQVAKQMTGPINKTTFLKAFQATDSINMDGLYTWHPNQAGTSANPRLTNYLVYIEDIQGNNFATYTKVPSLSALPYQ